MVTADLLCHYAHFADLSDEARQKLASIAQERVVTAGTKVCDDNDPADELFLVLHGEVELEYEMGSGETRAVDTVVDGELLVWSSLVEPYRCTAIGVAKKETHLIAFDAAKLRAFCEEDHAFGHQLLNHVAKMLADRLGNARAQLAEAS
jgi:CRP-like cAMP-binding protein